MEYSSVRLHKLFVTVSRGALSYGSIPPLATQCWINHVILGLKLFLYQSDIKFFHGPQYHKYNPGSKYCRYLMTPKPCACSLIQLQVFIIMMMMPDMKLAGNL